MKNIQSAKKYNQTDNYIDKWATQFQCLLFKQYLKKFIMLKNFEYKTHNLSDEEIKITIGLNIGLKRFVGKKNAIPG